MITNTHYLYEMIRNDNSEIHVDAFQNVLNSEAKIDITNGFCRETFLNV